MRIAIGLLAVAACGGVEEPAGVATAECAALCAEGEDCTDTACAPVSALYQLEVLEAEPPAVEVAVLWGADRSVLLAGDAPATTEPLRFRPGAEVEVVVGLARCSVYADELMEMDQFDCVAEGGRAVLRASGIVVVR